MFIIYIGAKDKMERYAQKGVRGLNPKTNERKIVDTEALYKVISDGNGLFALLCDKDLIAIAKEKGLIL